MIEMGQVLLKLDDEHEGMLRKLSKEEFGSAKGSLTKVIQNALDEYHQKKIRQKERIQALKELDELTKKHEKKLKIGYKFKREDAYEDRLNRF